MYCDNYFYFNFFQIFICIVIALFTHLLNKYFSSKFFVGPNYLTDMLPNPTGAIPLPSKGKQFEESVIYKQLYSLGDNLQKTFTKIW